MDMDISTVSQIISKFGFPIVAALGLGYFVYYVWTWATSKINPVIKEANNTLIALIDRIRMLDNDLIRLNQKLTVVLDIKKTKNGDEDENNKANGSS
jgi:hypothetical protein